MLEIDCNRRRQRIEKHSISSRQSRARLKHALLPTPAHTGIAKKTAVGATIQKASSN
jgi:hypothetical protein